MAPPPGELGSAIMARGLRGLRARARGLRARALRARGLRASHPGWSIQQVSGNLQ